MDDVRIGNSIRALRIHKGLRQIDVATRAHVSRSVVSRLEGGALDQLPLRTIRAIASALGAGVDVGVRWHGAGLDRVINAAHADLHESFVSFLASRPGWVWQPEVSFSIYGERGVIDVLAWHAEYSMLLIVELKTELVDPQDLVATMGRRVRLGREIARQFGWNPAGVACWVVVADSRSERRRADRHAGLLRSAFPGDGRSMRRWLREPLTPVAALSFWSSVRGEHRSRTVSQTRRVRRCQTAS